MNLELSREEAVKYATVALLVLACLAVAWWLR
jgi:hypothetical protein